MGKLRTLTATLAEPLGPGGGDRGGRGVGGGGRANLDGGEGGDGSAVGGGRHTGVSLHPRGTFREGGGSVQVGVVAGVPYAPQPPRPAPHSGRPRSGRSVTNSAAVTGTNAAT